MNLRSVFTAEQQRILQRYYENGMTNQSKNCFQLILQCAQETKLDFSVVRTWVGNKRRKMSSKNVVDSGGSPSATATSTLAMPPEVAVQNVVSIARSQSQQSSWTSSNNDVIVTGIYNPATSSGRLVSSKQTNSLMSDMHKNSLSRPAGKSDPDFQRQHIAVARQAPHCKNASLFLGEKTIILSRQTSVLNSGNSIYNHTKKSYGGSSVQTAELVLPQKPVLCHRPYKMDQVGCQRLQKPEHPILASSVPSGQRSNIRDPACSTHNLEIREVFSLAVTDQSLGGSREKSLASSGEASCLSIAMETGDVDDEYAREEELASMGAQIQNYSRLSGASLRVENAGSGFSGSGRSVSCSSHMLNARNLHDNILYHNRDYRLPPRTSLHSTSSTLYSSSYPSRSNISSHFAASNQLRLSQNQNNYQISGNLTVPWITGCSRKRATWIGNRRRKYRLMGIEVPPPRGGPAVFSSQSDSSDKSVPIPGDDTLTDIGDDNDRNDEVSICLSEGSSQEEHNEVLPNEDIGHKEEDHTTVSSDNVKIEIIDDEESDMISNSEVDQMSSLLDYKNEEVRFVESELEHQKQKYFELQAFTRSLILAVKTDDKEQQQALLADLPPELEEMDFNHTSPEPDDTSFSLSSSSEKNALDSL
ncbi:highly divergent homeobox isoform 2-T5 [Liasis olivaceus]